jgi:NTP pyrophosphatase (non-canonical NTP hydrolase)
MTDYMNFVKSVESTSWHQPNERLLHAAMGLVTEIGELYEVESEEHELEEIGDVLWYLALAHDVFEMDWNEEFLIDWAVNYIRGDNPLESLSIYSSELLDLVKKQIFYGKPIDLDYARVIVAFMKMVIEVGTNENESCPFTFQQVLEANVNKLKTRYPEKFTEEAAVNRDVKAEYAAMNG